MKADSGLQDHLGLFGGRRADGSTQLLVINPSGTTVHGTVSVDPAPPGAALVTADVVQAASLQSTSVTWNGSATPSIGLTEPGHTVPVTAGGALRYDFARVLDHASELESPELGDEPRERSQRTTTVASPATVEPEAEHVGYGRVTRRRVSALGRRSSRGCGEHDIDWSPR